MRRWHSEIDALPRNNQGAKRIRFAHLDDSYWLSDDLLYALLRSLVEVGGTGIAGTVSATGRVLTLDGVVGVTLNGQALLRTAIHSPGADAVLDSVDLDFDGTEVTDLGHTLSSLANGTRCTVVLALGEVLANRSYTDPQTSEVLLDQMVVAIGTPLVMEGDLSTWPTAPQSSLPVARITVLTGAVQVDERYVRRPTLRSGGGVTSVTADYAMVDADRTVLADSTTVAVTVTLPDPARAEGVRLTVKRVNAGANAVTLSQNATETIDGASTVTLAAQWDARSVVSDGVDWFIV